MSYMVCFDVKSGRPVLVRGPFERQSVGSVYETTIKKLFAKDQFLVGTIELVKHVKGGSVRFHREINERNRLFMSVLKQYKSLGNFDYRRTATTHAALIKRQNIYFMAALKLTMVNMENWPQMLHQHSNFDAWSEPVDCYSCCENCAHNMLIKECTCIICSSAETRKCFNRWW